MTIWSPCKFILLPAKIGADLSGNSRGDRRCTSATKIQIIVLSAKSRYIFSPVNEKKSFWNLKQKRQCSLKRKISSTDDQESCQQLNSCNPFNLEILYIQKLSGTVIAITSLMTYVLRIWVMLIPHEIFMRKSCYSTKRMGPHVTAKNTQNLWENEWC